MQDMTAENRNRNDTFGEDIVLEKIPRSKFRDH